MSMRHTVKPLRGVNLGGWLVLEKWMTPSLFKGTGAIDEYTFMQTKDAAGKLTRHRQTFITEEDWQWLSKNGIDAVRIPVGYWLVRPDGLYLDGVQYLDWAFAMAERYGLKVLIDLHGAPRSQNGRDHSGRVGRADWFGDAQARQRTIESLKLLHRRYKASSAYWGLQLLNEPPARPLHRTLRRFYRQAARALPGSQKIVFHDGFTPRLLSGVLARDGRAVMDIHLYHMASWIGRFISARQFVTHCGWWYGRMLRRVTKRQPVIIGEWSMVLRGESIQHLDKLAARQLMVRFGAQQLAVYERYAVAWFYWSYKTEGRGMWNFRSVVEDGLLELPLRSE